MYTLREVQRGSKNQSNYILGNRYYKIIDVESIEYQQCFDRSKNWFTDKYESSPTHSNNIKGFFANFDYTEIIPIYSGFDYFVILDGKTVDTVKNFPSKQIKNNKFDFKIDGKDYSFSVHSDSDLFYYVNGSDITKFTGIIYEKEKIGYDEVYSIFHNRYGSRNSSKFIRFIKSL